MTLRLSEEEFAELMRRRGRGGDLIRHGCAVPPSPKGKALEGAEGPKRSKYGNRKVVVDGMKFDSQKEADYYMGVLLPIWKAGELKLLARQVPFDLPGGIRYIADFVTVDREGAVRVIDTKSDATRRIRVYINKKKQMRAIWKIEIEEV
jgi:hypothetical protein